MYTVFEDISFGMRASGLRQCRHTVTNIDSELVIQHFLLAASFMPALPKNVELDPDGVDAWNLLLAAEDAALKKGTSPAQYLDEVTGVRVLGFFLLDFYTHAEC